PYGQLHYRYAGQGQPLLLLHQTASSSEQFELLMPTLAPSHRVLALDTPGYGMSDPPLHRYAVADYARCIVAFLDALHIQRTAIFGHHTGAALACEVAAAYPDYVDKLIAYSVPYWDLPPEELMKRIRPIELKDDGSHLMDVWRDITGRLRPGLFPTPYTKEALEIIHREVLWEAMAGERYHHGYLAIYNHDMLSRLPLIQAPTLLLTGDEDVLRHSLEPAAARIRKAQTRVVPGGSYFTTYDNPDGLGRVILDFLANARA
ncbi:MAG: alpha/beta hydrolase, partial [Chloroflexi bacterium]|nr:alpha/beta hydrolase [Chloroflexota bacterium]